MAGCVGRKLSVVKDENYHCVGERWRGGEVGGTFYKAGAMKEMKRRVLSGWA